MRLEFDSPLAQPKRQRRPASATAVAQGYPLLRRGYSDTLSSTPLTSDAAKNQPPTKSQREGTTPLTTTDELIARLKAEHTELSTRMAAIEQAIAILDGTPVAALYRPNGPRIAVGDDKLEAVRVYIRERGRVRQADITRELDLNSGTVSQATQALEREGEIEKGPKEDRSVTWRYVAA